MVTDAVLEAGYTALRDGQGHAGGITRRTGQAAPYRETRREAG